MHYGAVVVVAVEDFISSYFEIRPHITGIRRFCVEIEVFLAVAALMFMYKTLHFIGKRKAQFSYVNVIATSLIILNLRVKKHTENMKKLMHEFASIKLLVVALLTFVYAILVVEVCK